MSACMCGDGRSPGDCPVHCDEHDRHVAALREAVLSTPSMVSARELSDLKRRARNSEVFVQFMSNTVEGLGYAFKKLYRPDTEDLVPAQIWRMLVGR